MEWTDERCSTEPLEIEEVSTTTLIQRKDITKVEHEKTESEEAYTDYTCKSRIISKTDYAMLKSIEEIDTSQAIDEFTLQLMEGGLL